MSNAFDTDDTGIGIPSDQTAIVVLLVDDQAMIGEAVRRALAAETDIQFEYCSRGEDAIDHALRVGPTVILQDLVMPGVDGLDLVRAYRQHRTDCAHPPPAQGPPQPAPARRSLSRAQREPAQAA